MHAHNDSQDIVDTGSMLLAPLLTDGSPSREALVIGAQALVATILPRLPLSGSAACRQIAPNVMCLLALVAEHASVLLEAGAVSLWKFAGQDGFVR